MRISGEGFAVTDWSQVEPVEHKGDTGAATWRTVMLGDIRVRQVDYSPGYRADHWCAKGHVVFCVAGELHTELKDGRVFTLRPGMSYQVPDDDGAHRSHTDGGATLFIVD